MMWAKIVQTEGRTSSLLECYAEPQPDLRKLKFGRLRSLIGPAAFTIRPRGLVFRKHQRIQSIKTV